VKVAAARVAARVRMIAAHILRTAPDDVELRDGVCRVQGSARSLPLRDVARAAWTGQGVPNGMPIGLDETEHYQPGEMSAPYGSHIAVVEVARETGEITLLRYFGIDDFGVVINPLLAEGQVHGGLAQGIGQALYEGAQYDEAGVPVLDPPIPRFDQVPAFETSFVETPTPTNPLGAKGIGEAGAIAAPPAVVNAVIDALWHLGVREIDMPLTPERVLAAIDATGARP
jgi:carbon-monoxide dehydrogenase large subunit